MTGELGDSALALLGRVFGGRELLTAQPVTGDTRSSRGLVGGNMHIALVPVSFSRREVPPTDLPTGSVPNFVRHFF